MPTISLKPWLDHLETHLAESRQGHDPESIHQIRVATRHLDVWLRLGGHRVLRDDLRWLRREASEVRDLDVLLHRELPPEWAGWLREQHREALDRFRRCLEDPRLGGMLAGLRVLPGVNSSEVETAVAKLEKRVLRRAKEARNEPVSTRIHALRRSIRHLRYSCEWQGFKPPMLVALQDSFGGLNDAVIARRWFEHFPGQRDLPEIREQLDQAVEDARAAVEGTWPTSPSQLATLVEHS